MIKILETSELKRNYWDRTTAMYPGIKLSENVQSVSVVQNSPVALFIVLYKLVLTFECVDEILKP